jgi:hypothetical protein
MAQLTVCRIIAEPSDVSATARRVGCCTISSKARPREIRPMQSMRPLRLLCVLWDSISSIDRARSSSIKLSGIALSSTV